RACRALGRSFHTPERSVTPGGRARLTIGVAIVPPLLQVSTATEQRPQPPPIIIKEITVEGTKRVQEAVVLERIKSAVGSPFNPSLLSEDIRSIFNLGFF